MDRKKLFKFCFGCEPEILPKTAIITPFIKPDLFKRFCKSRDFFEGRLYSGMTARGKGGEFAVIRCGVGASLAGDAVLLLGDSPVRDLVFIGSCGGISPAENALGDVIVCWNAFNGEGFSKYHDMKASVVDDILRVGELVSSDKTYTEKLIGFLSAYAKDGSGFEAGDIFTIGSILAEYDDNLLKIKEGSFKGVDLELSAVYQAAKTAGIRATGMMYISDIPSKRPMWSGFSESESSAVRRGMEEVVRLSVDFASL